MERPQQRRRPIQGCRLFGVIRGDLNGVFHAFPESFLCFADARFVVDETTGREGRVGGGRGEAEDGTVDGDDPSTTL